LRFIQLNIYIEVNSNDNVTSNAKKTGNLLDGIDFNTIGSANKSASTNEIFNLNSSSSEKQAQNPNIANIFDTVFAKSSSSNSNLNYYLIYIFN